MSTALEKRGPVDVDRDLVARIRAMADAEGRRRYGALAQRYGLRLGEYDGHPCATVRDVAEVFGITPRGVRKALAAVLEVLPGGAITVAAAAASGGNWKFPPNVRDVTLVFWPGFYALATNGRGPAAAEVVAFLWRVEPQERAATAAAVVTAEEAEARVRADQGSTLALLSRQTEALTALVQQTTQQTQLLATLSVRVGALEERAALPPPAVARPAAPYTLPRPAAPPARRPRQVPLALVPPPGCSDARTEDAARREVATYVRARRAAGVTQETLARLLAAELGRRFTGRALSSWETGPNVPTDRDRAAWRKALAQFGAARRVLGSAA